MIDFDQNDKKKKLSELAVRIRSAREGAHMSQDALGRAIGVSDKSVSAYEQSRSTPPIEKLKRIAEATKRPLSYFTQEDPHDALIAATLLSIEREFTEVKRLLTEAKPKA